VNTSSAERWTPLEEAVPAEVLKAEVQTWARRIGVEPQSI
jgi:hypothetical protein